MLSVASFLVCHTSLGRGTTTRKQAYELLTELEKHKGGEVVKALAALGVSEEQVSQSVRPSVRPSVRASPVTLRRFISLPNFYLCLAASVLKTKSFPPPVPPHTPPAALQPVPPQGRALLRQGSGGAQGVRGGAARPRGGQAGGW